MEGYFWVGSDLMRRFLHQEAGWTEAWSSPCTAGVSDPEPLEPPEHPRKVGRMRDEVDPTGQANREEEGLGLPLVQ